jgi:hypothetical protein
MYNQALWTVPQFIYLQVETGVNGPASRLRCTLFLSLGSTEVIASLLIRHVDVATDNGVLLR